MGVLTKIWASLVLALLMLGATEGQSLADRRLALVIGNSVYAGAPPLANPVNDASDLAAVLKKLDFEVSLVVNADKKGLDQALDDFERNSEGADAILFYFAGHAMQFQGENYLLPVDAVLRDKYSLKRELTKLSDVSDALSGCGQCLKIMILDACRSNPLVEQFATRTRGIGEYRGLARMERPQGMVVVYATQPDMVAEDGDGRNSPFTSALLAQLRKPYLEIGELFRNVSLNVVAETRGRQVPEFSISGSIRRYFLNETQDDATAFSRLDFSDRPQLQRFIEMFPQSAKRPIVERLIAVMEEQEQKDSGEAEKVRQAELARQAAEAEKARQAELARQAAEAEKARQAELAKRAAEAEKARQAELAKRAAEAEKAREAELARQAAEAEKARQAELAKRAAEAEKGRQAELARQAAEVGKARQSELARRAAEAGKARQTELAKRAAEIEKARLAELAKQKQAADARKARQAELAKQAAEDEKARSKVRMIADAPKPVHRNAASRCLEFNGERYCE